MWCRGWRWWNVDLRFGRDPSNFRPYVPRLLGVAWGRLMAHPKGQRLDCWDLDRSQLSLLLSRRLAIGSWVRIRPAIRKWELPVLVCWLIMVKEGGWIAWQHSAGGLAMPYPDSSIAMINKSTLLYISWRHPLVIYTIWYMWCYML